MKRERASYFVHSMPGKRSDPESTRETEPPVVMVSQVQLQGVYSHLVDRLVSSIICHKGSRGLNNIWFRVTTCVAFSDRGGASRFSETRTLLWTTRPPSFEGFTKRNRRGARQPTFYDASPLFNNVVHGWSCKQHRDVKHVGRTMKHLYSTLFRDHNFSRTS